MQEEVQNQNPNVVANPQGQGQGQGGQPNPFDSSLEKSELESLQRELQGLEETKNADFAKYLSQSLSPEEKELFFEDEEAFFKNVLNKEEEFLAQRIGDKKNRAAQLEQTIAQKNSFSILEKAESDFLKKNPNADTDAMIDFYENDLPPREKRKLDNLPPDEFFESLYQVYSQSKTPSKKENLPKRTQGTPMDVENADYQSSDGYFERL